MDSIIPCDLEPPAQVLRSYNWSQAYRLTEKGPEYDVSAESILQIINWLDVEKGKRWQPTKSATFCNVYATDFAHACGAYLPRVWWTPDAEKLILSGKAVKAEYGKTAAELSANSLFRWLAGPHSEWFGWKRTVSFTEAQNAVNLGSPAVVCARKKVDSSPGHISVVAPETPDLQAKRSNGEVELFVQSQAGAKNEVRALAGSWWDMKEMAEWGIWIRETVKID